MTRYAQSKVRPLAICVLTALAAHCAGCSIAGHWTGSDLKPEMARDQYDLFRPADMGGNFVSADFRLQQDGTFTADLNYGGKLVRSTGNWKLDGAKLNLTDSTGKSLVFFVKQPDANTMEVVRGIKGTDVTLTLKKQQM